MRRAHKILSPRDERISPPRSAPKPAAVKSALLVVNAGEIATMAGSDRPRRGGEMKDLGLVSDGAILSRDGRIVEVGDSRTMREKHADAATVIDAGDRLVIPGFVDPHTHLVFAGSRENELEMKLRGATYQEIAASGGGLLSTVSQTRAASTDVLVAEAGRRLAGMLDEGTTTAEAKSGYALDSDGELRILAATETLGEQQPVRLVSTFLGAHAVPPEFSGRADAYVDLLVSEILPLVARKTAARFCDVWIEEGYFTAEQARRVLMQAKLLGLTPKVHADELTSCGGAELAAEMEAISADHLIHVSDGGLEAMKNSGTIAVLLPAASMSSRLPYADARRIITSGVPVALGTDLNPGNWVESMQFVISLAVHKLRMEPAEALTAATVNAAHAVNMAREVGSIEPGKTSDLLILDVPNHKHLGYRSGRNLVQVVIKAGKVVIDRRR